MAVGDYLADRDPLRRVRISDFDNDVSVRTVAFEGNEPVKQSVKDSLKD